jgi:hypothetical protein
MRLHRGSVLPRVSVERTPEGTLLRAQLPGRKEMGEIITIGIALLLFLFAALMPKGGPTAQFFRILQAGAVLLTFLAALHHYIKGRRLFRATLLVPSWPLRLGDTTPVRFRAMLRKSARVSEIAAKLQCGEQVTVGRGRHEQRPDNVLYEIDLPCATEERRVVDEEWTIAIPPELPPSFDVATSKIEWRITAMLGEVPAKFLLLVTPR